MRLQLPAARSGDPYHARVAGSGAPDGWGPALLVGAIATVTCLVVIQRTASDAYWTGDCANKALVAHRLYDTGFRSLAFDYPAAAIDPAGRAFPLPDLGRLRGSDRVSVFPVTYPALAAPLLGLGGSAALRWPAALGTGACATLCCLWLLPVVGRGFAAAAGLAFALATPLFFYGVTVWEHSLSIALVLAAMLALGREGRGAAALGGVLAGLATWLREEIVLFVLAVAIVEALRARSARAALPFALGAALPGLALAGFNAAAYATPLGPHFDALDPERVLAFGGAQGLIARLAALGVARGNGPGESLGLLAAAGVALAVGATAEWRRRGVGWALGVAAGIALAAWALGFARTVRGPALSSLVSHNGFLAQIPLVGLAGAGAVRAFRDERWRGLRPGIAAGLLFLALATAAGLATQSVFGMGLHIGPRKLLAVLPALFALAVIALHARVGTAERAVAALAGALLLAAGLASSTLAGWLLQHQKAEGAALQDWIRARPEPYLVSGDAMLTQVLTGLWHDTPTLFASDVATLQPLVAAMREREVTRFLVLASGTTPVRDPALGLACRPVAQFRGETLGYWNTDVLSCRLAPRRLDGQAAPAPRAAAGT
jgi:hypothetical protein